MGSSNLTYEERLRSLGMPTLAYRRQRGNMIELFKFVNNLTNQVENSNILSLDTRPLGIRGHSKKLITPRAFANVRSNFFSVKPIGIWNELPENVVNAPNIDTFKARLDNCWKKREILFNYRGE